MQTRSSTEDPILSDVPLSKPKASWTDHDDMILVQSLLNGVEENSKAPYDFTRAAENLKQSVPEGSAEKSADSCRSRWNRVRISSCQGTRLT